MKNVEHEVEALKQQILSLRREVHRQSEWIDTHNTPLWKRLIFVLQGYRFRRLGRWYHACWNEDAREWDEPEWMDKS